MMTELRTPRASRPWQVLVGLILALFVVACSPAADQPTTPTQTANSTTVKGETTMTDDWKKLTPDEDRVIACKGTEQPFTGEYWNHHEDGTYICRRCRNPLFASATKFDSGSGWPSFDQELAGAVKEIPDADGRRIEIVCATCDGHLGHVFRGERLTARNTRHCVNSLSLGFVPAAEAAAAPAVATAVFAGGCFWGVEHYFEEEPGVLSAVSGYIGGTKDNPTYKEVCNKDTGHAEAVQVTYDPTRTDYETLARLFFEIHDPTQRNRQGPDVGPQYRSAVFYANDEQKAVTEKLVGLLTAKGLKVATEVLPAGKFWPAEDYHQDYYARTGKEPYCHFRVQRF